MQKLQRKNWKTGRKEGGFLASPILNRVKAWVWVKRSGFHKFLWIELLCMLTFIDSYFLLIISKQDPYKCKDSCFLHLKQVVSHIKVLASSWFCNIHSKKIRSLQPATLSKKESGTGAFLWNLRIFEEYLFCRTSAKSCF